MNSKKLKRKSFSDYPLRGKIFVIFLSFGLVLMAILWLLQIVFLDEIYRRMKLSQVEDTVAEIKHYASGNDFESALMRISLENNVCVELIDIKGNSIYSSDVQEGCIIHQLPKLELALLGIRTNANSGRMLEYYSSLTYFDVLTRNFRTTASVVDENSDTANSIIFSETMVNADGEMLTLLVNSVITPVSGTVETLELLLFYVTIFVVIVLPIIAHVLAKRLATPIVSLSESAKEMAGGKRDVHFDAAGYLEIKELSDTLNDTMQQLAKVDNLKNELIANISHDLRTPLTLISGFAEVMRDIPGENNAENASIIVEETKRLTTLVNTVLDISKISSGTQELNLTRFNLTDLIDKQVQRMREFLKDEGYELQFSHEDEVFVVADSALIMQVFNNILANAVNYTGDDKTVKIKQIVTDGKVRVEIIDSGAGIPENELSSIWGKYYQSNKNGSTHKRGATGAGLGLSIVKSVMERHEGEYGVKSQLNEGSTFYFTLRL